MNSREQGEERRVLADALHSGALHLVRAVSTFDAAMGLTPARASALSVLVFGGPRTVGRLAEIERVTSPTMTALVHGLVADGLAERRSDGDDGRRVLVVPTARGTRLLRAGRARRVAALAGALADLDDAELALLGSAAPLLERLATTMPSTSR